MNPKANPLLPNDLFTADSLSGAWDSIERNTKEGRIQRSDLAYQAYLQEGGGTAHWLERVAKRLGLEEGRDNTSLVSDAVSIFKTFRLPPPAGLGYTRERLVQYTARKLRVISQSRAWALENPELVSELLDDPKASEETIRALIRASKPETERRDTQGFENRRLRFTSQDASMFDEVLMGLIARRAQASGGEVELDPNDALTMGSLVVEALQDWIHMEEEMEDGTFVKNVDYLPGGIYGVVTEEGDDVETEEESHEHAAD